MPRRYTNQQVIEAVQASFSVGEVLRKLGLRPAGGNFLSIKTLIAQLELDTKHFKGTSYNKDKFKPTDQLKSIESIRKNLIRTRGQKCEKCFLTEWFNLPITIEMDHIDGNRLNNHIENLILLCPNCHSYTTTWRRKKMAGSSVLETQPLHTTASLSRRA